MLKLIKLNASLRVLRDFPLLRTCMQLSLLQTIVSIVFVNRPISFI